MGEPRQLLAAHILVVALEKTDLLMEKRISTLSTTTNGFLEKFIVYCSTLDGFEARSRSVRPYVHKGASLNIRIYL